MRLGETRRLLSTDFAEGMVAVARRSSAELGLANVEHRVVDCEAIDLLSATVDGVLRRPASGLPHSPRLLQRFSQ
jgi:predicted O-methyltransferase YrrM